MPAFADLVSYFLDELFAIQPDVATAVGDHRYDDQWPDTSEVGRQSRLAFADRWQAAFGGLDPASLSRDERIDRDLVMGELDAAVFAETMLREDVWDPMLWLYLVGSGLHPLLAREFAPLHERLASVIGRLEGIPAIVADARATIGSDPDRPVSKLSAEVAGKRMGGVADLGRQAVETAEAAAPPARRSPRSCPGCARRPTPRRRRSMTWAVPARRGRAGGDGRAAIGEALFAEKLRHTLRDPEITPAAILARAEAEFAAVRAEMVRIARDAWPAWCAAGRSPTTRGRRSVACSTRSPPSTRPPTSWSRTAARSWSGSRPSVASAR